MSKEELIKSIEKIKAEIQDNKDTITTLYLGGVRSRSPRSFSNRCQLDNNYLNNVLKEKEEALKSIEAQEEQEKQNIRFYINRDPFQHIMKYYDDFYELDGSARSTYIEVKKIPTLDIEKLRQVNHIDFSCSHSFDSDISFQFDLDSKTFKIIGWDQDRDINTSISLDNLIKEKRFHF
jgi:hypothetical protein